MPGPSEKSKERYEGFVNSGRGGSAAVNSGVRSECGAQPRISHRLVLEKPLAPVQGSGAGGEALPSPATPQLYGEQPPTAGTS